MVKSTQSIQKKRISSIFRKYWWVIGVGLALGVWLWLAVAIPRVSLEKDRQSLGDVAVDIRSYADSLSIPQTDYESFSVCERDSSKYNNGPIRCGVKIIILSKDLKFFDISRDLAIDKIHDDANITLLSGGNYQTNKYTGSTSYSTSFTYDQHADVTCQYWAERAKDSTVVRYTFSCSKIVSDFLPGYTVE